ncbi:MAG: superinfection immunity protein [Actinomycetota bacterium]|nr:superinfection immunity protein [Actinomycetota bacterium]
MGQLVVAILLFAVVIGGLCLYFLPTIIAWRRHLPNIGWIVIINLAFGWSIIGWGIAFMMARQTDGLLELPVAMKQRSAKPANTSQAPMAFPSSQAPAAASGPEPGWYKDPDGSGQQRYWNGNAWTEHIKPA